MKNIMPHPFFKIGEATLKGMMWLIWVFRLLLLMGLIFVIVAISAYSCRSGKPPSITDAPFSVIAVIDDGNDAPIAHVYYAENVMDSGSKYILVNTWNYDGRNYKLIKGEKPLIKKEWSRIGVYRR